MKSSIFKYTLGLIVLVNIISCKKDNLVIDKDPLILPEVARFVAKPAIPSGGALNYYIVETPAPGSMFNIGVGVSTVSGVERKVKISYSSTTAIAGIHYTAPTEVIIPAGSSTGTLSIQGFFDAYPVGRKDVLKVKIVNVDGFVQPGVLQDSFNLSLQRYCEFDFADFEGDYENTLEYTASGAVGYGPYTTSMTDINYIAGATDAIVRLNNLYDYGGSVLAKFDWLDKGNFKVSIAEQNTGATVVSGGVEYALWIRTNSSSVSTFSSCENTITVYIDAIAKDPDTDEAAGNFSTNYRIVMYR
ncbi:MAG: hypothetical protein ABWZ25_07845 [Chitinophagaceae bacterium]